MNVYFVTAGDRFTNRIKIGMANDVHRRIAELQTGSPLELRLMGSIPFESTAEARALEQRLHRTFSEYGVGGEWFTAARPLREFIGAVLSGNKAAAAIALEWAQTQMKKRRKRHAIQRGIAENYTRRAAQENNKGPHSR